MQLTLFPLKTVLFPDGVLPLRVFEARYLDLVRDCMRNEAPFGVCLVVQGGETGPDQAPPCENIGCLADIVDWDMQQLGLLNIRVRGRQRFVVRERRLTDERQLVAAVELIPPDSDGPLAPEHQPCADLLRRIIDDLVTQKKEADAGDKTVGSIARPFKLESKVWVSNRLCEVLPVPLKAKQKLMELQDAHARLQIVTQYLKQHAVLK